MKRKYSRPEIMFESFSLRDGIANIASGGCTRMVTNHADGDCGIIFGGRMVFLENVHGCEKEGSFVIEDGSPIADYLCYHIPTESQALFNS